MGNHNPTRKLPARAGMIALAGLLAIAILTGCGSSTSTTASEKKSTTTQASTPPQTTTTTTTTATTTTPAPTTSSTPATHTTPAHKPERTPPTERIALLSPAVSLNGLQSRYTCDGQDTPLPLEWKGVPPHTAELMIDLMESKNVNGKLHFAWALTHIPPTTHGEIIDGKLPPGTVTGTNSNGETGYHLCPPTKGTPETYVAVIFALPHKLPAKQGFDPRTLRHEAENHATYQNFLIFNYTQH
jgi:phosphatidylethanolamine-binding protein (PEBP) family uncharacterized protein